MLNKYGFPIRLSYVKLKEYVRGARMRLREPLAHFFGH